MNAYAYSAYSCTAYRARVRKCKVLENCLRSCFKLEVDRCSDDSLWTNDQALFDYTDRGREQKPNGARRQNALSAYSCPVLPYIGLQVWVYHCIKYTFVSLTDTNTSKTPAHTTWL